jgi:hypothetical protein
MTAAAQVAADAAPSLASHRSTAQRLRRCFLCDRFAPYRRALAHAPVNTRSRLVPRSPTTDLRKKTSSRHPRSRGASTSLFRAVHPAPNTCARARRWRRNVPPPRAPKEPHATLFFDRAKRVIWVPRNGVLEIIALSVGKRCEQFGKMPSQLPRGGGFHGLGLILNSGAALALPNGIRAFVASHG